MEEFLRRIHGQYSTRPFRTWHLPLKPLNGIVGGLEQLLGHRLPLTRGQLAVFGNDSTVAPTDSYANHRQHMRTLDDTIRWAARPQVEQATARLSRECNRFSQYLLGHAPAARVLEGYIRAHRQGLIAESAATAWDQRMVAMSRRHRWLCYGIDSYCRFFDTGALLRRKLVLLLALSEWEPDHHDDLQLSQSVSTTWIGMLIALRLFGCGLLAVATGALLMPLRLLTPSRAAREKRGV